MGRVFTIADGLENIGALRTGGQGSVYKARRGELISAVKILPTPIHSEDDSDKNFIDFQNEVGKLQKVNEEPNPNVVKILSSGITESGSLPYIEMEFIEGPDLEDLLKPPLDTVFTIKECVKVAEQLSGALAHCHKLSVKHGDIKSNNVKLNIHTDNYVLLDFGLAVMSDEQRRTSMRNAGAIEFMAPEQHEGEMSVRSDVYSFGVVLYELLAGAVPFPLHANGESARNAIMISHMESPVPDILGLRDENMPAAWDENRRDFELQVPAWLLAVIAKCLEKLPVNRFDDGVELHKEIIEGKNSHIGSYEYDSTDNAVLKRDNDRLKGLLSQYQTNASSPHTSAGLVSPAVASAVAAGVAEAVQPSAEDLSSKDLKASFLKKLRIRNPKPILIGLGLFLACMILFARYSSSGPSKAEITDSLAMAAENQRLQDSINAAKSPVANTVNRRPQRNAGNGKHRGKGRKRSKH